MRRILLLALLMTLFPYASSKAIGLSLLNKPFGGKIIAVLGCAAPPGIVLQIGLPSPGLYIITPATKIHLFGVFLPRVWTLGLAKKSPIACAFPPFGPMFPIIRIGTGLKPAE